MLKSSNLERAHRINAALSLIKKYGSITKAANTMTERYGISKRQAYRYTRQANEIGEPIPIPDPKIAFTVKLSQNLIQRLREHSRSSGRSLSDIVTQSLEVFLQNGRGRCQKKQRRSRHSA
jgi:predicted DNA-binding transcriptional regulator YafY